MQYTWYELDIHEFWDLVNPLDENGMPRAVDIHPSAVIVKHPIEDKWVVTMSILGLPNGEYRLGFPSWDYVVGKYHPVKFTLVGDSMPNFDDKYDSHARKVKHE